MVGIWQKPKACPRLFLLLQARECLGNTLGPALPVTTVQITLFGNRKHTVLLFLSLLVVFALAIAVLLSKQTKRLAQSAIGTLARGKSWMISGYCHLLSIFRD
jgi:hypothetical protein